MPVARSSEAARAVAANAQANRIARAQEARQQAQEELAAQRSRRADTTTPLAPPAFQMEDLPDPPLFQEEAPALEEEGKRRRFVALRTMVNYRGRRIEIMTEGMTLDGFCDMLDKRFGVAE